MRALLIVVALHILLLNLVQFIAWPENFLWPYLSQNGLVFYKDIFALYPPVYYELLSLFCKIFGISVLSLQLFNYLIVFVTDILIWKVSSRKLLPVILFVPLQIFFEGNGSWPDLLLAPVFLGSYLAFKNKRWFLLGVLLTVSLLVKQTAVYFALILFFASISFQSVFKIILGGVVVGLLLVIYFFINENFVDFIRDAVLYILTFHSGYELQRQWPSIFQTLVTFLVFVPAIVIGVFKKQLLLSTLVVVSSLGVFTRFEFFHLQPALPFVAILLSISPVGIIFWLVFQLFFLKFFLGSFGLTPRFVFRQDFPKIKTGEETAFINTWDHFYYLSNTLPVNKVFIPSTPWTMDYPGNQEKIIHALDQKKPKYIFMNECFNVLGICYKPKRVYEYVLRNYSQTGELPDGTGVFQYDPMAVRQKP